MSIFKGWLNKDGSGLFTAEDEIRGLRLFSISDVPAFLCLEGGDGAENYMWWHGGNFRVHTAQPTSANKDSAGSVLFGSANAGASRALDNLATTAVNADIIFTDDIQLAIGDSSDVVIDWKSAGGMYWDFAAADSTVHFGNSNPSSLVFHGATGGYDAAWDGAADCFQITVSTVLRIGDTAALTQDDGVTIHHDGSNLDIDSVTANDGIIVGSSANTDFTLESQSAAGKDIHWDASAYTLRVLDSTILGFGSGDSTDYDIGMVAGDNGTPYLSFTQAIAGAGELRIGVDDAGVDVVFYSDAASDYMRWDASATNLASTELGALLFEDSFIRFLGGNNYDFAISTNDLVLDATDAATAQFILGTSGTNGLNVVFQSATAGDNITWDAGGDTFTFTDTGAVFGYDNNTVAYILQALTGDKLVLTSTDSADAELVLGVSTGTHGLDVTFQTAAAGNFIKFDAQSATLTFTDVSPVMADDDLMLFGSAAGGDIGIAWQNSGSTLDITCVAAGVGTVDFIELPVIMSAGDDNGVSLTIAGIDTTANANTVNITHSGSGFGLEIEALEVDSVCLGLLAEASQTHSMAIIDGQSVDWIGAADNTGMVQIIHGTTAIAHVGGTMLYVASDAVLKNSAEGHMARFLNTGAASATAGAVGVEIAVAATDIGLKVSSGGAVFNEGFTGGSVSRVATDAGTTTGTIIEGENFIDIDCDSDANHIIILPAPTIGRVVWLVTDATGCELRSSAPSTVLINAGTGGAAVESALPASTLHRAVCVSATAWTLTKFAANGTESAGEAAAT